MKPLTRTERAVLWLLTQHYRGWCLNTNGILESCIDLNRLQARRAIKSLERRGYIERHALWDDDGHLAGSGYTWTDAGRTAANGN